LKHASICVKKNKYRSNCVIMGLKVSYKMFYGGL
jgi:hypothetical protein